MAAKLCGFSSELERSNYLEHAPVQFLRKILRREQAGNLRIQLRRFNQPGSLDAAGRQAADVAALQEILKQQAALKDLHISFN